eukprot:COSAG02_NODE_14652_length_1251_cov_1.209201_2_plen_30_part_01
MRPAAPGARLALAHPVVKSRQMDSDTMDEA